MTTFDPTKRKMGKVLGAGLLVVSSGGILIPRKAEAVDPFLVIALINSLLTLYSINSQKEAAYAQLKASTEASRNQNYSDFSMQNSDPNILMRSYGDGGNIPLDCQGQVSKNAILTTQKGIPYLHQNGQGNDQDSNLNRWEASAFGRIAQQTGDLPIPLSPRYQALENGNEQRRILDKNGYDSDVWSPLYTRDIKRSTSKQTLMVASNGKTKTAILV